MTTLVKTLTIALRYKLDRVIHLFKPDLSIESLREKYRGRASSQIGAQPYFLPDYIKCKRGDVAILDCGTLVQLDHKLQVVKVLDNRRQYTWLGWHYHANVVAYSGHILQPIAFGPNDTVTLLPPKAMRLPTQSKPLQSSGRYYICDGHLVDVHHPHDQVLTLPRERHYTLLTGYYNSLLVDSENNVWEQHDYGKGILIASIPLRYGRIIDFGAIGMGMPQGIMMLTDLDFFITLDVSSGELIYEEAYGVVTLYGGRPMYAP